MGYMDFDRFQQAFKAFYRTNPKMVDGNLDDTLEKEARDGVLTAVRELGIEVKDEAEALQNIQRAKDITVDNDGTNWNSEVANLWRYFKPVKPKVKKPRKSKANEAVVTDLPDEEPEQ